MQEIIVPGFTTEVKIPRVVERLGTGFPRKTVGKEMAEWLMDNIGPGMPGLLNEFELIRDYHIWYSQTWFGYIMYHFKRAEDATMFRLRFG